MRIIEKILALFLLILLFPVLTIISILIKLESPGPILFRTKLKSPVPFFFDKKKYHPVGSVATLVKFRTMHVADEENKTHIESYPDTNIGRFLRVSRLDELPCLFSVLEGHISIFEQKTIKYPFYFRVASDVCKSRLVVVVTSLSFGFGYLYLSTNPHPAVYVMSFFTALTNLIDCMLIVYRYKRRIYGSSSQELQELINFLDSQKHGSSGGGGTKQLYPNNEQSSLETNEVFASGVTR